MEKILIANRGEIALRIVKSCRLMELASVAVYSEIDRDSPHVQAADQGHCIGPAALEDSYLNIDNILAAAAATGADAVHPGYGLLSENPEFAERVLAAGLIWIGPPVAAMRAMSSKISARELALAHGVPVVPARALPQAPDAAALADIEELGLPLLLKAAAGGGGIGMREIHASADLSAQIGAAQEQAKRQFGSSELLVERLLTGARHVEVQVLGDQHGNLVHLYDRDCSLQRRRQKLIEEAPAPELSDDLRRRLQGAALALAAAVDYQGVGTVEFLVSGDDFYLLEMNTRLQVEHGVTEAVTGIDLVEQQLRVARGEPLALEQADIHCHGHAIEARVYAERPRQDFAPCTGTVLAFSSEQRAGLRVDSGVAAGVNVSHYYDGLLCKLIVHRPERTQATALLQRSLAGLWLPGVETNQAFLGALLASPTWGDPGRLQVAVVEEQMPELLAAAELDLASRQLLLAAATVWRFRRDPPAADRRPWPGGFQLQRQSHWRTDAGLEVVAWQWLEAGVYQFADAELLVTHAVEAAADGLLLEINGSRHRLQVVQAGESMWVFLPDVGALRLEAVFAVGSASAAAADGACVSHGPGQVLEVLVGAGQEVERGDALVVIESMKMESTLQAAVGGQVVAVAVSAGDIIASGQLLLNIAPQEIEQ
ncbi:hypothetical protein EYC98_01090 [Halieaceae bacterium IMCC14734]|uniref:Biotin carboxylase n=1 Tax=Candidatus Litorirhabdus singularis TaxID=2518993 RepID=A0ABT3TB12_9GAMM|nr:biotin carboxylase N-terminal domain-containing protein [Candidatus Litorirhabdus singularis]MCX2979451.1 hypothetical protein [Candidatus Litorirhabdus singularis]